MNSFFKVSHRSTQSRARLGTITTPHGTVLTPAFVPVGTKGTIKALEPSKIKNVGIQLVFVNTYHLVTHPGTDTLKKAGGVHPYAKFPIPLLSDSGGFQVFSLARADKEKKEGAVQRRANVRGDEEPLVLKISEDGVLFRSIYDGATVAFTPETSMEFQRIIGADMLMAFDECTYNPATHEYTKKAMERTHEWLKRCQEYLTKHDSCSVYGNRQFLYGIIQGGTYEDLRITSAKYVTAQDTPGIAIGGVSVGESKKEMREQVKWVSPYLPQDRPVHLLGVGYIDDILDLVVHGIDTFDCVEPTRLARMGRAYQQMSKLKVQISKVKAEDYGDIDIMRGEYKNDMSPLDVNCSCGVCRSFTKSYLHHLYKQREILGHVLLTEHNLWVMERLMERIRGNIAENML